MIVKKSTIDDIPALVDLGRQFTAESAYGWEYSPENAAKSFELAITHPECACIHITNDDGVMIGAALISFETDFTTNRIGDINEFYISAEGRGSGAGRLLLDTCCVWFDFMGCEQVFVKATGNIESQGRSFENLFSKYGFKVFSSVLVRGI